MTFPLSQTNRQKSIILAAAGVMIKGSRITNKEVGPALATECLLYLLGRSKFVNPLI